MVKRTVVLGNQRGTEPSEVARALTTVEVLDEWVETLSEEDRRVVPGDLHHNAPPLCLL